MKFVRFDELLQGIMDWNFKKLITPSIIRVLYVIGLVLALVYTINYIAAGFAVSQVYGILATLLSGFVFAFVVLLLRVILEILVSIFNAANRYNDDQDSVQVQEPSVIETVESAVPTSSE